MKDAEPIIVFEFDFPEDEEVAHAGFIPGEVKVALNGLQIAAQRVQKDHIGYPQFVALGIDELVQSSQAAQKEEAAAWLQKYKDARDYMPEEERRVIFFPVRAGNLVEVNTVE